VIVPAAARVMICDDSAVIRAAIARTLAADPAIQVVARAANGQEAVDTLRRTPVDVIVLDIEMPVLDGIAALPLLLAADPGVRIVMASTLTTRGADIALRALRLGAADYIPKPSAIGGLNDAGFRNELLAKVRGLARLRRAAAVQPPAHAPILARPLAAPRPPPAHTPRLLAIGSSTGGPQALLALIAGLGKEVPVPVAITQHMPPAFTAMLATHITALGALPCTEAADRAPMLPGRIYLAPGNRHLLIEPGPAAGLQTRLSDTPPVNYCRPAVDPMLESAAAAADGRVLVAMLTGMGHDGLAGTRAVIAAGGTALAQDEATSVVWGMPGAIAQAGLCHAVLPLPHLAPRLLELLRSGRV
jgi:two-component system, chemotaxis family, protein-glutamate methylesterase/glutaminase